jgi:hypothetical protein
MSLGELFSSHITDRARDDRQAHLKAAVTTVALALGILGLWLLEHPYQGIVHDARLYVGFVLAQFDPNGVGQDIMFVKDGQFGFSIFPAVLTGAVTAFGTSLGAKLVSLAGLLVWIAAMGVLAFTIAKGPLRWVILLFVTVLPTGYGSFDVFFYAEPFAAPRLFAEAGIIAALALICQRRMAWALLPIAAAALFHPIMALPGLGIWAWFLFFAPETRAFPLWAGVVCAAVAVTGLFAGAALGLPLVDRLLVSVDPAYREILLARTLDLFPSAWPLADWARLFVQAATLSIAASILRGPRRALFVGALVVGLGGLAVSYVLGEGLGSLLILQAQVWRAVWVVALLSTVALAFCAVELWRAGGTSRLALGLLVIAWLGAHIPSVGLVAATSALIFAFWPLARRSEIAPKLALVVWGCAASFAVFTVGLGVYSLVMLLQHRPADAETHSVIQLLGLFQVWTLPVCVLAVWWAITERPVRLTVPLVAGAAAILILGAASWDIRTPRDVAGDTAGAAPALRALLASRPGEVLWLDGRFETWSLAGRPNWVTTMQGASVVFSRDFAMDWDRRVRRLIDLGLAEKRVRYPFTESAVERASPAHLQHLTDDRLEALCADDDAPAWLITPARALDDAHLSARWPPVYWTAPAARRDFQWTGEAVIWTKNETYAVIPCAS